MMIMYIVLVLFIEILLLIVNLLMNQPVCLSVIHSAELSVYLSVSLPVYWSVCLRQSVSHYFVCLSDIITNNNCDNFTTCPALNNERVFSDALLIYLHCN